jgi:hypothetical protein
MREGWDGVILRRFIGQNVISPMELSLLAFYQTFAAKAAKIRDTKGFWVY